ncbi:MAG: DUF4974 domain-containing protein [Prevotella sp.]|nr:DUF4974 domain-containing protein [Prevotella sp.]
MRTDDNNIIRRFFKSAPTQEVQRRFRWWLLNSDEQREHEECMHELFDETTAEITPDTVREMEKMEHRLAMMQASRKHPRPIVHRLAWAASLLVVGVLSAMAALYWADRRQEAEPVWTQTIAADGTLRNITLADGSAVTLRGGSTLIHPTSFTGNTRRVFLSGEATFKVAADKHHPFIVQSRRLTVTATGTEFGLRSYPSNTILSTVLLSGTTKVEVTGQPNKHYDMQPGQSLLYDSRTGQVKLIRLPEGESLSWRTGDLVFQDASFSDICSELEHNYGVRIVCETPKKFTGSYHVKFRQGESLTEVLRILKATSRPFSYRQEGNVVVIQAQ